MTFQDEKLPPSVRARFPRNGRTARELAEKTGLSIRSAQRWTSEPREDYLARADAKRGQAIRLRARGLSIRAIAEQMGCSKSAVHRYIHGA